MATNDLDTLTLKELEDEVATLAAHLFAGTCRWLEIVGELDRRGDWSDEGVGSCAEWLAWRCALLPRTAREHVRVARRLPELPQIHAAFAAGELSYAKVRALTRVATGECEAELLQLARVMTAAQLDRAVRAYRRVTTKEAARLQETAELSVYWCEDGSLEIHGRLAPEDGALLLRALDAMRDQSWRGSAEPRPARQATNAEALVAVADAALANSEASRSGGERYQVVVHADHEALSQDGEGGCVLADGGAIAFETARRLACDASLVREGHKSRTIPSAVRRALRRRDRGCRFPGCENRRFLDAHHVHHWAKGGQTTLDNLLLLCRQHHRRVHEGGYRVDPDGQFFDRWGQPLPAVPPLPAGRPEDVITLDRHHCIDHNTLESGTGEKMDLDLAVDAFVQIIRA